jgi:hypothetical protein
MAVRSANPSLLDGPPVVAFDTKRDSCELTDIPDAAARAFRDYKGTIHLIASHSVTRAGLGATLETTKHNCQVVYSSPHDGNIGDFNDYTWLNAFYNIDGKKIVALEPHLAAVFASHGPDVWFRFPGANDCPDHRHPIPNLCDSFPSGTVQPSDARRRRGVALSKRPSGAL